MIESLKIIMPDDPEIKSHLRTKFAEYTQRIQKIKQERYQSNPQLSYNSMPGYKALIIKRLFKTGEVETKKIASEIKEEFGRLDPKLFNSAAQVIYDYCKTGGKNVKKSSKTEPKGKSRD
jgi:esterase/lipase